MAPDVHMAGILKLCDIFEAIGAAKTSRKREDIELANSRLYTASKYLGTHASRRSLYIRTMLEEAYSRVDALEKEMADGHRL